MHSHIIMSPVGYDPNQLLDTLIARLHLKNDAALSRALDVARPILTGIRHGTLGVSVWLLQRMAEISDLSIADLRKLMGDQRLRLRVIAAHARQRDKKKP